MKLLDDLKAQILGYYDQLIIYLPKIGLGLIVLTLFWLMVRYFRHKFVKYLKTKADDLLLVNFIDSVIQITNIIIGILIFLLIIGQGGIVGGVLGAAGVSAFVIGFAFKDIGENFLAGIIMAFNRPFRLGDTIKSGEVVGSIVELSLRDTHIKTFDGKDVYVPNGQILKNPLYNYTIDGFLRKEFTVGVDYDTDIKKTRAIILEVLKSTPGIIQNEKEPNTFINELGTSTINIMVRYWIDTFDNQYSPIEIQTQVLNNIVNKLTEAGIGMPSDIIEVKNYKEFPMLMTNKEAV